MFSHFQSSLHILFQASILLLLTGILSSQNTYAALKQKNNITMAETFNPVPMQGDLLIPMPGNIFMIFRIVAVPADGFLSDMPLRPGRNDNRGNRAFYDRRYQAGLSAPFSKDDVPLEWKKNLPDGNFFFYLIAKYEVSRLQWRAMMEKDTDTTQVTEDDAKPVTDITWFDAVRFTEYYTNWLLSKHPEVLPIFSHDTRNTGFVRLPTELEWEYAARGGQNVGAQFLRQEDFFPIDSSLRLPDYAVYQAHGNDRGAESLARIGSRRPNPLGLYDTAGNAAEMTFDTFRFSVGGRLLGSAGGFVRKGGSFLSSEDEIMPGRREETAFFLKTGAVKNRDLGFRPVISGINTPGGGRIATLQEEYQRAGGTAEQVGRTAASTPMAELDRLIADADNSGIKNNLLSLRATLKENNIIQERSSLTEAASQLKNCLTTMESIRNYKFRSHVLETQQEQTLEALQHAGGERKKFLQNLLKTTVIGLKRSDESITRTLAIYKANLEEVTDIDPHYIQAAFKNLAEDYRGSDTFNSRMTKNLSLVQRHYHSLAARRPLSTDEILRNILNNQ